MWLVTGAGGFVGTRLMATLKQRGTPVRGSVRQGSGSQQVAVGNIGSETDWRPALEGVDVVVHLAARAHVMHEKAADPLTVFRAVNVDGTRRLAEQAAQAGVRRLVFVSSIKVNGERTQGQPFAATDVPAPEDAYGISKWEAEQALHEVAARTGLEVVVVRPPLVYGPGVKGNLERLIRLVDKGIPLPLGMVHNQRSLIGLDNLVDLLIRCGESPGVGGRTLLASDGQDVSTPQLIRLIAAAMGRSARLLPVPEWLLRTAGRLSGRATEVERLCGSLQVDIEPTMQALGWKPPVDPETGIRKTVEAFLAEGARR